MLNSFHERFSQMHPAARGLVLLLAITLALFVLGFWAGFIAASIEHGHLLPRKPLGWVAVAVGVLATVGVVKLLRSLFKGGLFTGMTNFDRRYWKMWLWMCLLGMPIGAGLVLLGRSNQERGLSVALSNSPISPLSAIVIAVAATILLAIAGVYYHRTIDDHEERAFLWGSQIAYYFLILAFPLHWLLARGGIVPALTIGIALLLVLVSCILQAIVWALFKFR